MLTTDAYDAYRTWMSKNGFQHPRDITRFSMYLNKMLDVKKEVKRFERKFVDGKPIMGQQTFFLPNNCIEKPPHESEQAWLRKCAEDFKLELINYKGQ